MIYLMPYRFFDDHKKKLVEAKSYIILDAQEDDNTRLSTFTNVVTMDNLAVPAKLLHQADMDPDTFEAFDTDAIKELENNFFKSTNFETAAIACISAMLDEDANVFIVIRNKAFDYWREKYRKTFIKIFPDCESFFVVVGKKMKSIADTLTFEFSKDEIAYLRKKVRRKEEELEAKFKEEKKHKKKKKGKKNKKLKKSGLGFADILDDDDFD